MPKSKGQFNVEDKRDGYWEYYYENGQLRFKGNFINGIEDGLLEFYYENGQLHYKGNFINGNKDGWWEYYHSGYKCFNS
jgi:antitoxin component YwqK of YwqJK toxin-antitoxin module